MLEIMQMKLISKARLLPVLPHRETNGRDAVYFDMLYFVKPYRLDLFKKKIVKKLLCMQIVTKMKFHVNYFPCQTSIALQLALFRSTGRAVFMWNAHVLVAMNTLWAIQPRRMRLNLDTSCISRARKVNGSRKRTCNAPFCGIFECFYLCLTVGFMRSSILSHSISTVSCFGVK